MYIHEVVQFVEGKLTNDEREAVIRFIIENPFMFEVVGGLNGIKKQLPPNENLNDYLDKKKQEIQQRIFKGKE